MPRRKTPTYRPALPKSEVVGQWVDELDYSAPRTWIAEATDSRPVKVSRIKFGVFRASIHRLVGAGKDQWFLTCDPFIRARHLGTDLDGMTTLKDRAVVHLMDMLTTASTDLAKAINGGSNGGN